MHTLMHTLMHTPTPHAHVGWPHERASERVARAPRTSGGGGRTDFTLPYTCRATRASSC